MSVGQGLLAIAAVMMLTLALVVLAEVVDRLSLEWHPEALLGAAFIVAGVALAAVVVFL